MNLPSALLARLAAEETAARRNAAESAALRRMAARRPSRHRPTVHQLPRLDAGRAPARGCA